MFSYLKQKYGYLLSYRSTSKKFISERFTLSDGTETTESNLFSIKL